MGQVDLAVRCNYKKRWTDIVFIDDFKQDSHEYLADIVKFEDLLKKKYDYEIVISVGEPISRKKLFEKLKRENFSFATLVDPTAIISPSACLNR